GGAGQRKAQAPGNRFPERAVRLSARHGTLGHGGIFLAWLSGRFVAPDRRLPGGPAGALSAGGPRANSEVERSTARPVRDWRGARRPGRIAEQEVGHRDSTSARNTRLWTPPFYRSGSTKGRSATCCQPQWA